MLRILEERSKAGVEVRVIGQVSGRPFVRGAEAGGHAAAHAHDHSRRAAGVRGQPEPSRRGTGLAPRSRPHRSGCPTSVKALIDTFEADWSGSSAETRTAAGRGGDEAPVEAESAATPRAIAKAVNVFTKELQPLAATVKKAVRQAVVKAGRRRAARQGREGHDEEGRQAGREGSREGRRASGAGCRVAEERGMTMPRARTRLQLLHLHPGVLWLALALGAAAAGTPAAQVAPSGREQARDAAAFREFSGRVHGVPQAAASGGVDDADADADGPAGD